MKRPATGSSVRHTVHPLLRPPAETTHQLSDEGAARVEDDPDLSPGLDSCGVCAGPLDSPLTCPTCDSVVYCSLQHLRDDALNHAAVCSSLCSMRHAERLVESKPEAAAAEATSVTLQQSAARMQSEPLQPTSSRFQPPQRSWPGWQHIAPDKFLPVYPRSERQGGEDEDPRASKRQRKLDGSDLAAAFAPDLSLRAADERAAEAPGSSESPDAPDVDKHLQLAADLAERTAILTYAYTATHALQGVPAVSAAARRAASEHRPLTLVVLGAAVDAELGDLASWQVVAEALGQDVQINFVGPEVPDHLDGTEARYGRVAMRFQQGTYQPGSHTCQSADTPDVYLAFNPGFTCPDYNWSQTVKELAGSTRTSHSSAGSSCGRYSAVPLPCLVTATNTGVEAQMDADWLGEFGWCEVVPAAPNPYTSLKLIQSGTLANDLYRKNAWLAVYEHRPAHPKGPRPKLRGGRGGKRGAKAAARRAAKALYNAMMGPLKRLMRRR